MSVLVPDVHFTREMAKRRTPGEPRAFRHTKLNLVVVVLKDAWEYYEGEAGIAPLVEMAVEEFARVGSGVRSIRPRQVRVADFVMEGEYDGRPVRDVVTAVLTRHPYHGLPQIVVGRQREARLWKTLTDTLYKRDGVTDGQNRVGNFSDLVRLTEPFSD